jgi:hypothetical protein
MAVDLSFITEPTGTSNSWEMRPSGSDTKDSDNLNYVLQSAAARVVPTNKYADVCLKEGTFWLRKATFVKDFRGVIRGEGCDCTLLMAGTQAGGPMDLLTSDEDRRYIGYHRIPSVLTLANTLAGGGSRATVINLKMKTTPSADRPGFTGVFDDFQGNYNPWENEQLLTFIQYTSLFPDLCQFSRVDSVSGNPSGGVGNMHVHLLEGHLDSSDIGKSVYIWGAADAGNNDQSVGHEFKVVNVISPTELTVTNPNMVVNADEPSAICLVFPNPFPIGRCDLKVNNCEFEGSNSPVRLGHCAQSNLNGAIQIDILHCFKLKPTDDSNAIFAASVQGIPAIDGRPAERYCGIINDPINGVISVTNCNFLQGNAPFLYWNWATDHGITPERNYGLSRSFPQGVVQPKCLIKNNTLIDCVGWSRSGGASLGIGRCDGITEVDNNTIINRVPCMEPEGTGSGIQSLFMDDYDGFRIY